MHSTTSVKLCEKYTETLTATNINLTFALAKKPCNLSQLQYEIYVFERRIVSIKKQYLKSCAILDLSQVQCSQEKKNVPNPDNIV